MVDRPIASAVALPEPEENSNSSDTRLKRLQSSVADGDNKRRRLSITDGVPESQEKRRALSIATTDPAINTTNSVEGRANRRKIGAAEERKRGQRLFGALLGTLSQSSSSAAQKRRADIEKKQQAKLRLQAEEYNELTRKKHEDLLATRRKEQMIYDKESMHLRHSNMLAMANFLKTTAEPVLYYKPWQLRPQDEAKIKEQIEEAKAVVAMETAEFEQGHAADREDGPAEAQVADERRRAPSSNATTEQPSNEPPGSWDTVGANANPEQVTEVPKDATATNDTSFLSPARHGQAPTAPKGHEDDSGEVVMEDKEDTVIY